MSLRRTGLVRRTELRRTPLQRKTPMRRQGTRLQDRVRRARRDTGPSNARRLLVIDRAVGSCEICGRHLFDGDGHPVRFPHSIHHRQPRGMGGTRRPEANSPANLLLLCGDATTPGGCHAYVESNRTRAYGNGWLVAAAFDPAIILALLEGGDWYRLNDDGQKILEVAGDAA